MKGHHCHHSSPLVPSPVAKRRCTGLAAAVPLLVACSILLPLAFLLAIHRPGYGSEERAAVVISTELGFGKHKHLDGGMKHKLLKDTTVAGKENQGQEVAHEENPKSCELEYGSYCLWSVEHKEVTKDAIVKRLKDQLFMARAHYPSIAKLKHQEIFTRELKQNIQEHERMLSDTIADADLPPLFAKKLGTMEHTIERAKSCEVGCSNVERKLRQLLDLTEDEAYFHTRQSAFLYHLGVQTMPKTHHCLKMRLTVEYFKSTSIRMDQLNKQKLESPTFHHYVMFSRNVLAASTTINSTVMNSKDSDRIVFHLFTDAQNFYAMKHWFDRNSYLEATVHVTTLRIKRSSLRMLILLRCSNYFLQRNSVSHFVIILNLSRGRRKLSTYLFLAIHISSCLIFFLA